VRRINMTVSGAGQIINDAVSEWDGVTAHPHRFGGIEYRLGSREIGHVHGDRLVDIPFPTRVRNELVAAGEAAAHHVLPESGWVSFYIREPEDVAKAVALLRRSYDLAVHQQAEAGARRAR
jgi:Family of unknown function (DUF5519)